MSFRINAFYKFDSAFLSTLLLNIHALAAMKELGEFVVLMRLQKRTDNDSEKILSISLFCFILFHFVPSAY